MRAAIIVQKGPRDGLSVRKRSTDTASRLFQQNKEAARARKHGMKHGMKGQRTVSSSADPPEEELIFCSHAEPANESLFGQCFDCAKRLTSGVAYQIGVRRYVPKRPKEVLTSRNLGTLLFSTSTVFRRMQQKEEAA